MKRPKNRDRSRLFICTGENFRDKAPIGDCGDVKTLMGWLIHLSNQDEEYLDRFFDFRITLPAADMDSYYQNAGLAHSRFVYDGICKDIMIGICPRHVTR